MAWISIHAPTRGATKAASKNGTFVEVFQSTLPREERPPLHDTGEGGWNFNPRSHERSDTFNLIVAPHLLDFNPRSHERSDSFIRICFPRLEYFNPRSHERSDGLSFSLSSNPVNFNPRSHERSDTYNSPYAHYQWISIHAPTRGATQSEDNGNAVYNISIHAPTRGATC